MEQKTTEQVKQEMLELSDQFSEFLHTKGIVAKFKLAFSNMAESAKQQCQQDKIKLNKEKSNFIKRHEQATSSNKDFVEFIHAKGLKAKCRLVVENFIKGVADSKQKTAENIAKVQTTKSTPSIKLAPTEISAETLTKEFNAFLQSKGLSDEYVVTVENYEN